MVKNVNMAMSDKILSRVHIQLRFSGIKRNKKKETVQ